MTVDHKSSARQTRAEKRDPMPGLMPPGLPPHSIEAVGRRLRAAYDTTIKEPLPVRLTDLVATPYVNNGRVALSYKCSGVDVVVSGGKQQNAA